MAGVRLAVTVRLPRDVAGLQMVRAVTDPALAVYGVTASCRHDIAVALTEACGNAIKHATAADEYEVAVKVADGLCVVEVTDYGPGFHMQGAPAKPPASASSGRGLYIIGRLVDRLHVDTHPGCGTTVRFVRQLEFTPSARQSSADAAGSAATARL